MFSHLGLASWQSYACPQEHDGKKETFLLMLRVTSEQGGRIALFKGGGAAVRRSALWRHLDPTKGHHGWLEVPSTATDTLVLMDVSSATMGESYKFQTTESRAIAQRSLKSLFVYKKVAFSSYQHIHNTPHIQNCPHTIPLQACLVFANYKVLSCWAQPAKHPVVICISEAKNVSKYTHHIYALER